MTTPYEWEALPGRHGEPQDEKGAVFLAECAPVGMLKPGTRIRVEAGTINRAGIYQPDTFIVRFTRPPGRKGHPRAALEAVLRTISPTVFETEILDA